MKRKAFLILEVMQRIGLDLIGYHQMENECCSSMIYISRLNNFNPHCLSYFCVIGYMVTRRLLRRDLLRLEIYPYTALVRQSY
ncbi:MAG: hypothetical protein J7J01_00065 [Methanophagales archaeon]|nr:hypothetical protein [Methanophagales archaeon]